MNVEQLSQMFDSQASCGEASVGTAVLPWRLRRGGDSWGQLFYGNGWGELLYYGQQLLLPQVIECFDGSFRQFLATFRPNCIAFDDGTVATTARGPRAGDICSRTR